MELLLKELLSPKTLLSCPLLMLNPVLWNVIVRMEYKTHVVSRLCGGPRKGVIAVAIFILSCNFVRTSYFRYLIERSTKFDVPEGAGIVGYVIIGVGLLLVLSSAWSLGFYNTFLGDYFGILMDEKVTGFPFNVLEHPMYWGAFLIYLGEAICYASAVAILLSVSIGLSYFLAAVFEGPFTTMIYDRREAKKA